MANNVPANTGLGAGNPTAATGSESSTTDTTITYEQPTIPFDWTRDGTSPPDRVASTAREDRKRYARGHAATLAAANEAARESAVIRRLRQHFTLERIDTTEAPF